MVTIDGAQAHWGQKIRNLKTIKIHDLKSMNAMGFDTKSNLQ